MMEQLELDIFTVDIENKEDTMKKVLINIGGKTMEILVPKWVFDKGPSFVRGWLKVC